MAGRGQRGRGGRGSFGNRGRSNSRGRGRGGGGRGGGGRGRGRGGGFNNKTKSDKFGDKDGGGKRPRLEEKAEQPAPEEVEESSSSEEEEVKPYTQLLSMFQSGNRVQQVLSSDEEDESEDDNQSVEDAHIDEVEEEGEEAEEEEDETAEVEDEEEEVEEEAEAEKEEEEIEIPDSDGEDQEEGDKDKDTFHQHFEKEMNETVLQALTSPKPYETKELKWNALGRMVVYLPTKVDVPEDKKPKLILEEKPEEFITSGTMPALKHGIPLKDYGVRAQLCNNLGKKLYGNDNNRPAEQLLSPLQHELFSLAHEYRDIYYPEMNFTNCDEIRTVYCLHALNHVLKSRDRVLYHNTKLKKASEKGDDMTDIEYRDQGLVRPRVLIITPLRSSAVQIVEKLTALLLPEKGQIVNKPRFYEEFGEEKEDATAREARKGRKPEDFEAVFSGNSDDSFRIGVGVAKRTLKLYAGFYLSDILIASPLGLKTLLAEDFDFLCSIEVLVLDQTDILYMQNWDHVVQIFDHLHLQPREQHDTDMGRIRLWALNGYSSHYRQNLIFSSIALPEAAALFSRRGTNFAGKVRVENIVPATSAAVCRVVVQLPQAFHRFPTSTAAKAADDRFHFFTKKILPQYREALMTNTLIFVPSYFDYVRLRNYMHKEDVNFGQACEYTPDGLLAQVRNRFFLGEKRLLLYTERLHFYRRLTIKGIHHIIFYQLPSYPQFYGELSNLLQDAYQSKKFKGDNSQTCTVLYSSYDAPRLAAVVGTQRAAEMLTSDRPVHLFVSGGS